MALADKMEVALVLVVDMEMGRLMVFVTGDMKKLRVFLCPIGCFYYLCTGKMYI